jgi:precorrin isomerase
MRFHVIVLLPIGMYELRFVGTSLNSASTVFMAASLFFNRLHAVVAYAVGFIHRREARYTVEEQCLNFIFISCFSRV